MRTRFFGQFLLSKGLITAPQLLAAVEYQDKYNSRLGELATALGMITPFDVERVNAKQVRDNSLFGEAAIALGCLTEEQLQDLLATQRDGHVHLGQAIETLGYLNREGIDAALTEFTNDADSQASPLVIPEEVHDKAPAIALFEIAQKLLLRAWELPSKISDVRIETLRMTLSDHNVRVVFEDGSNLTLLVGVPHDVASKAAVRLAAPDVATDRDADQAVLEFATLLAQHFSVALAERGHTLRAGAPILMGARATIPPEVRVAMLPCLTHLGQVLIGLGF